MYKEVPAKITAGLIPEGFKVPIKSVVSGLALAFFYRNRETEEWGQAGAQSVDYGVENEYPEFGSVKQKMSHIKHKYHLANHFATVSLSIVDARGDEKNYPPHPRSLTETIRYFHPDFSLGNVKSSEEIADNYLNYLSINAETEGLFTVLSEKQREVVVDWFCASNLLATL